jgi:hypothetical protein
MNTVRRITIALVCVVTTCVLSAGAAAAHPDSPRGSEAGPVPVTSPVAPAQPSDGAKSRVQLRQQAYAEHMQRLFAAREAAAVAAHHHAGVGPGSPSQAGSGATSRDSSGGTDVTVLAVTALAGLALGAAGSTAARRVRARSGLAA